MYISTQHTIHTCRKGVLFFKRLLSVGTFVFKSSNIGTRLNVFYTIIFSYFGTSSRINILHTTPSLSVTS